jgi:hypothetical protein
MVHRRERQHRCQFLRLQLPLLLLLLQHQPRLLQVNCHVFSIGPIDHAHRAARLFRALLNTFETNRHKAVASAYRYNGHTVAVDLSFETYYTGGILVLKYYGFRPVVNFFFPLP